MEAPTRKDDDVDVGALADLPEGAQRRVLVGATPMLLCRDTVVERVWAIQERCPHAFQSLSGGVVQNGEIQCPKHGACFDLATGRPTNDVTARAARVHAVTVDHGRILVAPVPLATKTP